MTDRELLHKALDALSQMRSIDLMQAEALDLPETIRLRLAEPEEAGEPDAYYVIREATGDSLEWDKPDTLDYLECNPLYLHLPRPAVRLSDEELMDTYKIWEREHEKGVSGLSPLGRAIEAAVLKANGLEVKDD